MITCNSCNKPNEDNSVFCAFCGNKITVPPPVDPGLRQFNPPPAGAPNLQNTVSDPANPQFAQGKDPTIAVLCSLFPGGGQFYNGEPLKGIIICSISFITAPILIGIFPYIYGFYDAYMVASKQKKLWK